MSHNLSQLTDSLAAVEARLADRPTDLPLLFEHACLLTSLGQTELARQAYLRILHIDPMHLGTLNNFGALLFEAGFTNAARLSYAEAIRHHPEEARPQVNLANLLLATGEPAAAQHHYETALRLDPANVAAHHGLCAVFQETGDEVRMQHHRREAFTRQPVLRLPWLGESEPRRLLVMLSGASGNLPWQTLIDTSVFAVTTLAPSFVGPPLPPHDMVFNVIGDADSCAEDLRAAEALLRGTSAPVINPPGAVLASGRLDNARRLRGLAGVLVPRVALLPREALAGPGVVARLAEMGLGFPLLLRRAGFHTGKHFARVDEAANLPESVAALPGAALLAIEYLDATGPDGLARKYRVMFIDGRIYPLHLAISPHWKVHYYTAAMDQNVLHQAEEAAFLGDMAGVLGERAMAGLRAIQTVLGLDYAGADFALDGAGRVLLFEANATMLVQPPDPDPQWAYRRPAIEAALQAARRMLLDRATAGPRAIA